jgi:hypothetical protein
MREMMLRSLSGRVDYKLVRFAGSGTARDGGVALACTAGFGTARTPRVCFVALYSASSGLT